VTSSRLCKLQNGALYPFQVKLVKEGKIIRSTFCTFTKQTIDRVILHRDAIPSSGAAQQITELVDPTARMLHARIDYLECVGQSRTPIAHDQPEVPSFKPSPIEFMKQTVSRSLTLPRAVGEGEQLPPSHRPGCHR